MGRPLKIKQSTTVDIGFNNFANLDSPTQVIPPGMTDTEYLGVVGGGFPGGIATPTYPTVFATAFVPSQGAEDDVYIVTQKGATKYLVACVSTVAASSLTVGFSYIINSVGDTNWQLVGGAINAQVGDIFTATANGSGTGLVSNIGVCTLANVAPGALSPGEMQITATVDGTAFQVSKMTNKYVWDYSTPAIKYAANFFDGAAAAVDTAGSGADIATWTNGSGNYALAEVTEHTS